MIVLRRAEIQVDGNMVRITGSSLYSLETMTHRSMPLRSIKTGNRLLNRSASISSMTLACSRSGSTWVDTLLNKLMNRRKKSCFSITVFYAECNAGILMWARKRQMKGIIVKWLFILSSQIFYKRKGQL